MLISWAPNRVDVVVLRGFAAAGTYADTGAVCGDVGSFSRALFDRGWTGLHCVAGADEVPTLATIRPGDVVTASLADLVALLPSHLDVAHLASSDAVEAWPVELRPACVVCSNGAAWDRPGYALAYRDGRHTVWALSDRPELLSALALPPDDDEYEAAELVSLRLRAEAAEQQLAVARTTLGAATARRIALERRIASLEITDEA